MPPPATPGAAGAAPAARVPAPPASAPARAPGSTAAAHGGAGGAAGGTPTAPPAPIGKDAIIEKLLKVAGVKELPRAWLARGADALYDAAITDAPAYDAKIAGGKGATAVLAAVSEQKQAFVAGLDIADPVAKQKFLDMDAEVHMVDVANAAAKDKVYTHVEAAVRAAVATGAYNKAEIYAPYLQGAGGTLDLKFKGKKISPADWASFPQMFSRNTAVGDVYKYAINNQALFEGQARTDLTTGLPPGAPAPDETVVTELAKVKFREAVAGKDVVAGGGGAALNGGANATRGAGWFTPDKIKANDAATNGYADAMIACSLQPEWYPEGTVVFEFKLPAAGMEIRKPTAYDGLMSAMWVARSQPTEEWGVLGSGLRECLISGFKYSDAKTGVAHVPPANYIAALTKAKADYEAKNVSQLRRSGAHGATMTEQISRNTPNATNPTPENARPDGRLGAVQLGQDVVADSNRERTSPTPIAPMTPAGRTP